MIVSRSPMPAMVAAVLVALSVRFSPTRFSSASSRSPRGGSGLLCVHGLAELTANFALAANDLIQPGIGRAGFRAACVGGQKSR
jgi:hypothetical protein